MSAKTPAKRRKQYSPAERDAALAVLASTGSSFEASELTGIPDSTLRDWKIQHAERYAEIQEREAPRLEAIAARQAREIIIRAGETEHSLLDILQARIREDDAPEPQRNDFPNETLYLLAYERWVKRGNTKELAELAGTLQRVTTSKGINGTKLLELTGRPTSIVEHREGTDILKALGAKVPGLVIDSTAEELPKPQQLTADSTDAHVPDSA